MKVAITGVMGQVCSHVADAFIAAGGWDVLGIDNGLSGVDNTPEGVELLKADVGELSTPFLKGVDAIIHGASYAELAGNWNADAEREKLFANNEVITRRLLEAMPAVPIVYLSSASVYGSQCEKVGKVNEFYLPWIESPYAASKLACEHYVKAWAFKRGHPFYILRLCNQMGSRTHRGIVPDFVRMAKAGHIHARDDGTQYRSWIHVKDTAQAIVALLEARAPSGVYNVASDELWSWRGLLALMNFKGELTWESRKAGVVGDPVDVRLDTMLLRQFYRPKLPIAQAFIEALEWAGWPEKETKP